ncbi:hypothetical protein S-PM2d248 [Synechococcus phage S-PM2]|uniref:Hypothetical-Protein / belonging to T4-LIKE GC: 857 n=1 Tax=Synechococcus phage S-PM2 TaxID=238854 RepID=D8FRN7_BPSYP|nr:Hypothetical-Protein / belonging to T4-LIKE GC: 857 [Synechococcus phage S-PM2]CBR26944.1 Hypothetical-Protein / belonging to T4-LIKE GC: 857 [Synechococcus phage S-PM2]CFW42358.1 hypothetical protein S-PM2d248 [Synechococcus phage S-PM2]
MGSNPTLRTSWVGLMVRCRSPKPCDGGSNPSPFAALLAQWNRAFGYEPKGHRFKSCRGLDIINKICHNKYIVRAINSAVEFLPYKQAVTGSNPVSPITT